MQVLVTDVGTPGDKDQAERKAARVMDPIEYDGVAVSFTEVDVSDAAQVWAAKHQLICQPCMTEISLQF